MTRILDGFAQPDIEATRGSGKRLIFVETHGTLSTNATALKKSIRWLKVNEPDTRVDLVMVKPRKK